MISVLSLLGFVLVSSHGARIALGLAILASGIAAFHYFMESESWKTIMERPGHR